MRLTVAEILEVCEEADAVEEILDTWRGMAGAGSIELDEKELRRFASRVESLTSFVRSFGSVEIPVGIAEPGEVGP